MGLLDEPEVYERVIWENDTCTLQIRITINTFREIEYFHFRKYYKDFDESWYPSPEGVALPLDFDLIRELFVGISEIMSLAESREIIEEYFADIIKDIYRK